MHVKSYDPREFNLDTRFKGDDFNSKFCLKILGDGCSDILAIQDNVGDNSYFVRRVVIEDLETYKLGTKQIVPNADLGAVERCVKVYKAEHPEGSILVSDRLRSKFKEILDE